MSMREDTLCRPAFTQNIELYTYSYHLLSPSDHGGFTTEGLGEGQHIDRRGRGHCYKGPVWWLDGLVVPWLVALWMLGCLDIGPKVQHSGRRCNSTKLSEKNGGFQQLSQTTTRCQTKRLKLLCRPHLLNEFISRLSVTPAKESFLDDFRNTAHDLW